MCSIVDINWTFHIKNTSNQLIITHKHKAIYQICSTVYHPERTTPSSNSHRYLNPTPTTGTTLNHPYPDNHLPLRPDFLPTDGTGSTLLLSTPPGVSAIPDFRVSCLTPTILIGLEQDGQGVYYNFNRVILRLLLNVHFNSSVNK